MKRTDFFKALGALIISPLAVKGLLKDNGCLKENKHKVGEFKWEEPREVAGIKYSDTYEGYIFVGDLYVVNHEEYMVSSFHNGKICLKGLGENLPEVWVNSKDLIGTNGIYPTDGQIFI
jgi:hypothetical protein